MGARDLRVHAQRPRGVKAELAGYETGRGSVRLPYGREAPTNVLGRIVAYRVREHDVDVALWILRM